jgi:hypothetical protein
VTTRKLALLLATLITATLVVMVAISLVTGASQEAHEWYVQPADYAAALVANAGPTRALFAADLVFLVLYTAFFATLAEYLRTVPRPMARSILRVAVAAIALTALLDLIENHHILVALDMAEHGQLPSSDSIALQEVISQVKFGASYVGLLLFGLAIPRDRTLGLVLSLFLSIGVLATGVLIVAAPPAWRAQLDAGRWYGFLVGFGLTALWLRGERDATATTATTTAAE